MKKELEQIVKPPIGLRPKWVSDKERLNETIYKHRTPNVFGR